MNWGLPEQRIGLVCASPRPIPADLEASLDGQDAPLVLVGFGGLGLSLSRDLLSAAFRKKGVIDRIAPNEPVGEKLPVHSGNRFGPW